MNSKSPGLGCPHRNLLTLGIPELLLRKGRSGVSAHVGRSGAAYFFEVRIVNSPRQRLITTLMSGSVIFFLISTFTILFRLACSNKTITSF